MSKLKNIYNFPQRYKIRPRFVHDSGFPSHSTCLEAEGSGCAVRICNSGRLPLIRSDVQGESIDPCALRSGDIADPGIVSEWVGVADHMAIVLVVSAIGRIVETTGDTYWAQTFFSVLLLAILMFTAVAEAAGAAEVNEAVEVVTDDTAAVVEVEGLVLVLAAAWVDVEGLTLVVLGTCDEVEGLEVVLLRIEVVGWAVVVDRAEVDVLVGLTEVLGWTTVEVVGLLEVEVLGCTDTAVVVTAELCL
jgi:hypothetical protein